jgi:hypothetical protein
VSIEGELCHGGRGLVLLEQSADRARCKR